FEHHARAVGLIAESTFVDHTLTPRAYPVFRLGETEGIEADRQTLRALGINLAGRQGRFEFLTSHVAAEQARKVAQAL
ncbi:MAG TPA: hypothetical protein VMU84_03895, partial [Thermoanaerobaculia bacterium]|nr:hypothetical protein [Thermoanaerobaculia bacterium]